MKKYRIQGIDCAQCANNIEVALRKMDGFDGATVNFATNTIVLPSDQREEAERVVALIEPGAQIVDRDTADSDLKEAASDSDGFLGGAARIIRIAVALVLAVIGVAFGETLRSTPYRLGEYAVFMVAYLLVGWPVLASAARNIVHGRVFDEMFLMSIATVGAIVINEMAEAVAVMLFYSVGEYIQDRAVGKSRRSIASLMDLRPESARMVTDEGVITVDPERVEVGSVIEVRAGERVPLDGEIVSGESAVDTSALTGESAPRSVATGDQVLSGFVNEAGLIRISVTKPLSESSVSRILELVEDAAARKAPTERFISKFAAVYTPIVVAIAAVIAFVPPLLIPGAALSTWVYRALVALVISCPCALVISIPLGYLGGIGGAARSGILVKGANYLDSIKDLSTVVFDKTGTLTRGEFRVTEVVARDGFTSEQVLEFAATAESRSSHPIARSIRAAAVGGAAPSEVALLDVREEKGYGIIAWTSEHVVVAGSDRLLHREQIDHSDCDAAGTVVYVAVDGTYAGYIAIADELKPEARSAVQDLRALGIETIVMLTGDNRQTAERIARQADIDTVYAELLPEEKVAKVEELAAALPEGKRLAFVGDGINDAPVIMRSDIGIAMGAMGSDAAIEAADIVLMDDQVSNVAGAIRIASHTRSVVMQNIVLALLVKLVFLGLGAVGIATMWEAVLADMGVSVAAVLNATRTLRYASSRS